MIEIKVERKEDLDDRCQALANRLRMTWDGEKPLALTIKLWQSKRTKAQNKLYWAWLNQLAEEFSTDRRIYSKDDLHDLLRHKFLGTEFVEIGGETFNRLPSTTKLGTGEMAKYMMQIEAWAVDMGVYLPVPAENEYNQYREAMQ